METIRPEDFNPEDAPWFFDALHSYAVTYMNTNFRPDVSLRHNLRDIMPLDQATDTIREGVEAGDLVLVEGGARETLYVLLRTGKKLFTMNIPRTFPEIDAGYTTAIYKDYSIDLIPARTNSPGEIKISGKPAKSRRGSNPPSMSIVPGDRVFGVLKAPFPPQRSISYSRSR